MLHQVNVSMLKKEQVLQELLNSAQKMKLRMLIPVYFANQISVVKNLSETVFGFYWPS